MDIYTMTAKELFILQKVIKKLSKPVQIMKQRKNGLEDQSIFHEPIKAEKVGRKWIAFTKYWVGDADLRMDVQQSGDTEQEAREKLNKFLTGKEPHSKTLKDSTYSLVTGKRR